MSGEYAKDDPFRPFEFMDHEPQFWEFEYKKRKFVLREASTEAGVRFRNSLAKATKFENGKPVGAGEGAGESAVALLSGCLFEKTGEDKERPVPRVTFGAWPDRITQDLFTRALKMSGLDQEMETVDNLEKQIKDLQERLAKVKGAPEQEKNSLSATTSISA